MDTFYVVRFIDVVNIFYEDVAFKEIDDALAYYSKLSKEIKEGILGSILLYKLTAENINVDMFDEDNMLLVHFSECIVLQ